VHRCLPLSLSGKPASTQPAALLAADNKITDPTILSQLYR
jgi:hypothetical protein